jgi:hypothetical protein
VPQVADWASCLHGGRLLSGGHLHERKQIPIRRKWLARWLLISDCITVGLTYSDCDSP